MTSKFWQDVEELAALNQRRWPVAQSRYVLLELQRMAAEKYAEARRTSLGTRWLCAGCAARNAT